MKKFTAALIAGAAVLALPLSAMADVTLTETGTLENVYDAVSETNLLVMEGANGYYLSDLEGNALTSDNFSSSFSSNSYGYITGYELSEDVNCEGLLDQAGNVLIPFEYGEIKSQSPKWVLAYKLEESTATSYDMESWFTDKYYLIDTVDVYYISESGAALVASLSRDDFLESAAHGDYISVQNRTSGVVTMYDSSWNEVATDLSSTYSVPDDVQVDKYVTYRSNGQQGLQDHDGNIVLEAAYYYISTIRGDYVNVSTGDFQGLVDINGNVIVPAECDRIYTNYYAPTNEMCEDGQDPFIAAGYIAVEKDGKAAFYDISGNLTCEPKFSTDLVDVCGASGTYTDLEGKTHILAADGTDSVIEDGLQSVYAMYGSSGLLYKANNKDYDTGVIDWHGNVVVPFENGSVDITGDGKYLLIQKEWGDPTQIFEINYGLDTAAPAADPAAVELPAEEGAEAPAEGTDEGAEAPAAQADTAKALTLINSAVTLADTDAAGNASAIASLLENAIAALGDANPSAAALLSQALDQVNAGGDGASISALLSGAAALLG